MTLSARKKSITMPITTTDGKTVHIDSLVVNSGSHNLSGGHVFDIIGFDDEFIEIIHLGEVTKVDAKTLTFVDGRQVVHLRLQVTVETLENTTVEDCGAVVLGDRNSWSPTKSLEINIHGALVVVNGLRLMVDVRSNLRYEGGVNKGQVNWVIANVSGHIPWVNFKGKCEAKLVDEIVGRYDFEVVHFNEDLGRELLEYMAFDERSEKPSHIAVERMASDIETQRRFNNLTQREIQIYTHIALNSYDVAV